jgi:hypothetical protein
VAGTPTICGQVCGASTGLKKPKLPSPVSIVSPPPSSKLMTSGAFVEIEYDAAVVFIEFNEKPPSSVETLKQPSKSSSMSWSGSTGGFRPKSAARLVNDSALHPPNMMMPNEAAAMELRMRDDDMESSGWVRPYVETAYQFALSAVAHMKMSRVT